MKFEVGAQRPEQYQELWPDMWKLFSHYESVANVPSALFLITTRKENGKANACFHSGARFPAMVAAFSP